MLKRSQPRNHRASPRAIRAKARAAHYKLKWGSLHERAIDRLSLELRTSEGMLCLFHSGVGWQALMEVIKKGMPVQLEKGRSVRAGSRRYVPDLIVRCPKTGALILLIEVWHTHAVSQRKRLDFTNAGLPWIEVRASHVLSRFRSKPLPVLDWGGLEPTPPIQRTIFEEIAPVKGNPNDAMQSFLTNWAEQLGSRFALSKHHPILSRPSGSNQPAIK